MFQSQIESSNGSLLPIQSLPSDPAEGRGGLGQCWLLQLVGDELDRTCLSSCLCYQVETHTGIAHQSLVQVDQEHLGKSFGLNETIIGNYLFEW